MGQPQVAVRTVPEQKIVGSKYRDAGPTLVEQEVWNRHRSDAMCLALGNLPAFSILHNVDRPTGTIANTCFSFSMRRGFASMLSAMVCPLVCGYAIARLSVPRIPPQDGRDDFHVGRRNLQFGALQSDRALSDENGNAPRVGIRGRR